MPPRYVFGVPAGLVLRLRPGFSRSSAAKPRFANLKTSPQFAQRTDPRPQRHDPLALPASKPHLGTSTHGRPADPRRTTSASASSLSRVSSAAANTMAVPRASMIHALAVQPRHCELQLELTDLTQILSFCSEAATGTLVVVKPAAKWPSRPPLEAHLTTQRADLFVRWLVFDLIDPYEQAVRILSAAVPSILVSEARERARRYSSVRSRR